MIDEAEPFLKGLLRKQFGACPVFGNHAVTLREQRDNEYQSFENL